MAIPLDFVRARGEPSATYRWRLTVPAAAADIYRAWAFRGLPRGEPTGHATSAWFKTRSAAEFARDRVVQVVCSETGTPSGHFVTVRRDA